VRGYALPNDGPVNEADLSTNHQATIATLTADLAAERAEVERLRAFVGLVREFVEDDGEGDDYPSPIDHKYEAVVEALAQLSEEARRER